MTLDLVSRQRDEALTRLAEVEPIVESYAETAAELERCQDLLRRLSAIIGVQEFDSLEVVATKKMAMLESMMRKEVGEGMREAARLAASTHLTDRIAELEEQVRRLQAKK